VRAYIDIINEAVADPLDQAMQTIADYIQNNQASDFVPAMRILKQHGYQEQFGSGNYWRALFHSLTPEDMTHENVGDLFETLKSGIRMDMKGHQSFTTSFDKAWDFVRRTIHVVHGANPPEHTADTPLEGLKNIIIIYEVVAPAGVIVFSMRALSAFLDTVEEHGAGWTALDHCLHDMWEGYYSDDEVMIDTAHGVSLKSVHLYSSDRDSDDA
jgi:hypothetical protein